MPVEIFKKNQQASGSFNNGSGNAHVSITGGGYFDTGHDEINGMDFYYNSGNIAQYDITFYGVIKSWV